MLEGFPNIEQGTGRTGEWLFILRAHDPPA